MVNIYTKFLLMATLCSLPITSDAAFVSVKAMGRGGAVMADPVDSLTIAYNPAGLAWMGGRLDIGGYWVRQSGTTTVQGNEVPGMNGSFNSQRTRDYAFP